ncbi:MAG: V-type ATP synthase subunit D [Candidatus Omnitrophica bacterium]|nr:V-type ATP synthase subunit D [Candidatus Omnitrophota bacterium]
MAKIKLTKGELKKQRDALRQYERYLPTLQLKKQQLQLEILHQLNLLEERRRALSAKRQSAVIWAGLLAEGYVERPWLVPERVAARAKNIAGVDIPVFEKAEFGEVEYDLFAVPLWVDTALEALREIVSLMEEMRLIERGVSILRGELRITTQRVNLFEKVKIPEAKETIRLIKIYLGDQMANAVGRSKIAKNKIEQAEVEVSLVS